MSDNKTIEQRKAEYRYEQLSDRLRDLVGEDGSMFCCAFNEALDLYSMSMCGDSNVLMALATILIRGMAEEHDGVSAVEICESILAGIHALEELGKKEDA